MAVRAELDLKQRPIGLAAVKPEWQEAVVHCAKLYGLGYDRKEIKKVFARLCFADKDWTEEKKLTTANRRLRGYELRPWFRDLIWEHAVVRLDLEGPQILKGVARKAKRGRVDAAKLALSITGRHVEKQDSIPAAVTINLVGIPRPDRQAVEAGEDVVMIVDED